ncbi:hypothetical protein PIB30_040612 [Stylosanthes scabra]|uniref:Uncharacterized protein n=1 Tax=Stylosanthes scabra TaxID=79078 RepID=A0ABU6SF04_9FABA|nr:hypothetical protein [Stylosanthes scabra]
MQRIGFISLVSSEAYWTTTKYLKTDPPIIKRPIGRSKVQARKKDPVEVLIEGNKLKKTFRITCSKCGEKGHNYRTWKGAPANNNPGPTTRKKRRGESSNNVAPWTMIFVNLIHRLRRPSGRAMSSSQQAQAIQTKSMEPAP